MTPAEERRIGILVQRLDRALGPLVGSAARARVLGLLMLNPQRSFYVREIAHLATLHVRAVERQLARLLSLGLITRREGRVKVFYQATRGSPLVRALRKLCQAAAQQ